MSSNLYQPTNRNVFWGEIAPCEHMAQFYERDNEMLDTLAGFIGGGLKAGDGAIVIATVEHLSALSRRLISSGVDVASATAQDQYIPLVAENVLSKFMVKQWPDEELFAKVITEVLFRARGNGRRVRAFGEMVALLWARGDHAATVSSNTCGTTSAAPPSFPCCAPIPKQDSQSQPPPHSMKSAPPTPGSFDARFKNGRRIRVIRISATAEIVIPSAAEEFVLGQLEHLPPALRPLQ